MDRFDVLATRPGEHEGMLALDVDVEVDCSLGNYVRALARDVGDGLGVGGDLTALRRTRVGSFLLADAAMLDDMAEGLRLIPLADAARELFWVRNLDVGEVVELGSGGAWPRSLWRIATTSRRRCGRTRRGPYRAARRARRHRASARRLRAGRPLALAVLTQGSAEGRTIPLRRRVRQPCADEHGRGRLTQGRRSPPRRGRTRLADGGHAGQGRGGDRARAGWSSACCTASPSLLPAVRGKGRWLGASRSRSACRSG